MRLDSGKALAERPVPGTLIIISLISSYLISLYEHVLGCCCIVAANGSTVPQRGCRKHAHMLCYRPCSLTTKPFERGLRFLEVGRYRIAKLLLTRSGARAPEAGSEQQIHEWESFSSLDPALPSVAHRRSNEVNAASSLSSSWLEGRLNEPAVGSRNAKYCMVCLQTTDVSKDRLLWCLKARLSLVDGREWPLQASPKASIVEARRLGSPVEILLSGKSQCLNEAWRTWNLNYLIVLRPRGG
jgi:hypothetical protein